MQRAQPGSRGHIRHEAIRHTRNRGSSHSQRAGARSQRESPVGARSNARPLGAGDIARHSALATASVTNLLDRLEQKGFVRRVRDTRQLAWNPAASSASRAPS
jgi:hypothetical protein